MPTIKGSFTPKEKKVEATEDKRSKVEIILDAKRRELVDYIIEQVKAGELPPWQRPTHNAWHSYNLESGLPYRGGNQLILALESIKQGYEDPRWMTEKQLKKAGYSIDKEIAKPVVIECWTEKKIFVPKEVDENGKPVRDEKGEIQWKPLLDSNGNQVTKPYRYKYASVYNGSVIEGLEPYVKQQLPEEQRIKELDTILANSEAPIFYDSPNRNYYIGGNTDEVHLEPETHFKSRDHLYATALHEIGHSTGHSSRLNRDMTGQKGDPAYAQEELVAEFTAAMLNDKYNLPFSEKYQKENSASYIEGWASALAKDPAIMFYAASQASKAATYIENNMLLPHLEKENVQEQVATQANAKQVEKAPEQVLNQAVPQPENDNVNLKNEQAKAMFENFGVKIEFAEIAKIDGKIPLGGLTAFHDQSKAREYLVNKIDNEAKSRNTTYDDAHREYISKLGGAVYEENQFYRGKEAVNLLNDLYLSDAIASQNALGGYNKVYLDFEVPTADGEIKTGHYRFCIHDGGLAKSFEGHAFEDVVKDYPMLDATSKKMLMDGYHEVSPHAQSLKELMEYRTPMLKAVSALNELDGKFGENQLSMDGMDTFIKEHMKADPKPMEMDNWAGITDEQLTVYLEESQQKWNEERSGLDNNNATHTKVETPATEKEVPTAEQEVIPIDVPAVTDDVVKKMPVMENPNKTKQVEPEQEFFTPHYEDAVYVDQEVVKKANTPEALRTNASAEAVKDLQERIPYELTDKQAKVVELAAFKYHDGDGVDPYIESKIGQAKDHNHLVNLAAKHLEVKSSRNMFDTIKGLPEDRVVTCVDDMGKQQPMSETQLAVVKPLLDAYREYPSVDNQKALSEGMKTVSLSDRKLVFDPDKVINRSIQEHMAVKKCIGGAKGELKKSQSFKAAKAR